MPSPRKHALRAALALSACLLAGCAERHVSYRGDGIRLDEGPGKPGAERREWTFRYFDGNLRARGSYDGAGRREGTWVTYFRSGQRASEGERRWDPEQQAALREGPWSFWHENGFRRASGIYRAGQREGLWEYWGPGGEPDNALTGSYSAGELQKAPPTQD